MAESENLAQVIRERDALRKKVEGQEYLLRAYRLGGRPPEKAFKLIEQANKVLQPPREPGEGAP